jgi:predicted oxidoreductase
MKDSKLIYGCMGLGGNWDNSPLTAADQQKADEVIQTALEAGIHYFDHADIYTFGKAEEAFGNFLKQNPGLRKNLFIQSKTGIELLAGPLNSSHYNSSEAYIDKQVDAILKRLCIDQLDALLIHRPDPLTSMEDLARTLQNLKQSGRIKAFGVSNMSVSQISLLQTYLDEPLITNQIQLNLNDSQLLDLEVWVNRQESPKSAGLNHLLGYSAKNNLSIQAYSSLAQGKYAKASDSKTEETIKMLDKLARKYESSRSGILLAWLWRIPATIQAIIGTTNLNRIKESAQAQNIQLSRKEWYELWITSKGVKLP